MSSSRLSFSRTVLATLAIAASPATFAAPAQASDTVLANAPEVSGITAYGGQVILSQADPATGEWALVRYENGALTRLPVAERAVPFDADAGPDAAGNPVVVYSRCSTYPSAANLGLQPTLDWETASGCNLYELSLTGTASEHELTAAGAPGESETTPSIWQGNLAFVRHAPNAAVPTIEYLAAGATKPRHLSGGSVPVCNPVAAHAGCTAALAHETVDQLDLGPTRVSYVWSMVGGSVYGTGIAWEMRAATLDGGRSTLLDAGLISGACGFREPTAPTATSGPIAYLEAGAVCDTTETNFATADPVTGVLALAPTPGGLAATAVRDGNTIYWLRITGPAADVPAPGAASCVIPDAACQLVASSLPNYVIQHARAPESSPADIDVVASGLGYTWLRGPAGVRLLRPPATIPCAPSASAAILYASAQWTRGRHTVVVSRQDPHQPSRGIATTKRTLPTGVYDYTKLLACGASIRLTYSVSSGGSTQRVSFAVTRLRAPAKTH